MWQEQGARSDESSYPAGVEHLSVTGSGYSCLIQDAVVQLCVKQPLFGLVKCDLRCQLKFAYFDVLFAVGVYRVVCDPRGQTDCNHLAERAIR